MHAMCQISVNNGITLVVMGPFGSLLGVSQARQSQHISTTEERLRVTFIFSVVFHPKRPPLSHPTPHPHPPSLRPAYRCLNGPGTMGSRTGLKCTTLAHPSTTSIVSGPARHDRRASAWVTASAHSAGPARHDFRVSTTSARFFGMICEI